MNIYKHDKKNISLVKINFLDKMKISLPMTIIMLVTILFSMSLTQKVTYIDKKNTVYIHDTISQIAVFRGGLTEITINRNDNIPRFCFNPGNIRPGNSEIDKLAIGTIQSQSGPFLYFPNEETGFKALKHLLKIKYNEYSISDCISKYAPPNENNTEKYIREICDELKISRETKVKNININKLSKSIARIEGYYK